jgi:hypothetical protein
LTTRCRVGGRHRISKAGNVVAAMVPIICVGVLIAPSAAAGAAPEVEQAVTSARGAAACGPLQYNPTVERAADIVNSSTLTYLNHNSENVPADDPHPTAIVKDLGINTDKVVSLQGAGHVEADAVKGLLLQGYKAIPDCSYTDFGVSLLHEEQSNLTLVAVVLVGS